MAEQCATTDQLPLVPKLSLGTRALRGVMDKVLRMTLLWLGFGIVVGVISAPPEGGIIGMIAGAVAGMILFPFLGAFLGLIGGQWRETLLGGIAGLAMGFSLGVAGGLQPLPVANVGLVGGALVGATFVSYVGYLRKGLALLSR